MRIVSLVPSVTETLLAWDVVPVAVTRFCEHPELPTVGGTKDPDIDAIVALAPDLVVLCDEENRKEDAAALARAGVATCSFAVESVADAVFAVQALAPLVGLSAPEPGLVEPPPAAGHRPVAFVPIWRCPWMTMNAQTYGASLLETIGIANAFADDAVRYPAVTVDQVVERRPDLVIAPSEPYPFGPRHVEELARIAPVELVDGQDLFWWGIRTPAAIDRLRERLAAWTA